MKRICIVFDHPYTGEASFNEPHNRSFSATLLLTAKETYEQAGYTVDIIDLHKDGFDPVMHKEDLISWRKKEVQNPLIKNYQERIMNAEELIFIFPIWWEAMPAMMKGFFDKVITKGIIYEEVKGRKLFKNNLVNLKKVKIVTVMATPHWIYKFIFGSPITKIVFRGTFRKMGFNKVKWFNYSGMHKLNINDRKKILDSFGYKIIK
ncbi:NADPH-q uinone reductase [Listeria monocytogenes]|uniref:NAD(P)H-dependent oxidoreductase n=1 Tax=Listeria monocytogenes TaxID=1639 RepID=UPI000A1D41E9|nr:NAD(P)H-dependent oxidoreductase [Listeria monocytogenes]ARM73799.1 NADPH-q uinone reductase [Listeria monocytogenes]